jgi:hypothetical protein
MKKARLHINGAKDYALFHPNPAYPNFSYTILFYAILP